MEGTRTSEENVAFAVVVVVVVFAEALTQLDLIPWERDDGET